MDRCSEEVLKKHEIDPENYVRICLNAGSVRRITRDKFIRTIIEEIEKQHPIEIESEDIFGKFETYVEKLASNGKKLIIALDEFECIAPILDSDFSYWFRFILTKSNVAAITASRTTVRDTTVEGMASPLFNIFGNIFLGLFSRAEIESTIKEMFRKSGMEFDEKETSFLANLSGGNPYLIQCLGYYYYEERRRKEKTKMNYHEFENEMIGHLNDQFENYWKHLTKEERNFLAHPENKNDPLGHTLKRKEFLVEENGKWKVFSTLFQKFVVIRQSANSQKKPSSLRAGVRAVVSLVVAILGITLFVMITRNKPPRLLDYLRDLTFLIGFLSLIIGLCSLVFSILSFRLTYISLEQQKRNVHEYLSIEIVPKQIVVLKKSGGLIEMEFREE